MRELYVKEGNKELRLDFSDDTIVKVDGKLIEKPKPLPVSIISMTGGTRFKIAYSDKVYVRLNGGDWAPAGLYLQEGTWNVFKAGISGQGEVIR